MPQSELRIAVWHNLPPGGARRSIAAQVAGLIRRGHRVDIWSPLPAVREGLMPFDERAQQHAVPLNFDPVAEAAAGFRIGRAWTEQKRLIAAMEQHSRRAVAQMQDSRVDVLLATNCLYFHSPLIGRFFTGPKLLYLQDPKRKLYTADERLIWRASDPAVGGLKQRLGKLARDHIEIRDARLLADLDYRNTAAFDRLLVNSWFSRESMLRAYNLDSRVCYLGIDASLFSPRDEPKEPYVIGVGSITPNKNIEFLVRALATISQERPRLVWVGQIADPAYAARLGDLARGLSVDLQLRVEVPDAELVVLLRRAAVFVYAPRLEPFGFAPLEANACGTVAIGVPEGGLRESIAEGVNGFLVEPEPRAFGDKVAWLLSRPERAASMGLRAAEHVRSNWTWDKSVERLEVELMGVVGRN